MKKKILLSLFAFGFVLAMPNNTYAEGWSKSGSDWIYLDKNNYKLSNEWKKGADDKWRYLSDNGVMATNSWVDDDKYYVDEQGLIVEGWKKLKDRNGEYWAYFQSGGKAVKGNWKIINDKYYYFDDEGKMLTGWILDNDYYINSDGTMVTGWCKLMPPDSEEVRVTPNSSSLEKWFYFTNIGKKFKPVLSKGAKYGEKKIDGVRYAFDENGELVTGWIQITGKSNPSIKDFKYMNEDGTVRTGWYSIQPPDELLGNYNNLVEWFYFSSTGEPYASKTDNLNVSDLVKIDGKQYLFDKNGTPVYGIQKVYQGNSYAAYYFGESSQCYLIKGKQTIKNDLGKSEEYFFQTSTGKGITGTKDHKLYYKGRLVRANEYMKYQVFSVPNDNGSSITNYVVNASGKIVSNGKVKDADKVEYKTNSAGILVAIDGDTNIRGSFETPLEPEWVNND